MWTETQLNLRTRCYLLFFLCRRHIRVWKESCRKKPYVNWMAKSLVLYQSLALMNVIYTWFWITGKDLSYGWNLENWFCMLSCNMINVIVKLYGWINYWWMNEFVNLTRAMIRCSREKVLLSTEKRELESPHQIQGGLVCTRYSMNKIWFSVYSINKTGGRSTRKKMFYY